MQKYKKKIDDLFILTNPESTVPENTPKPITPAWKENRSLFTVPCSPQLPHQHLFHKSGLFACGIYQVDARAEAVELEGGAD